MLVKICGITNREDALAAVEAGATAIGFNFYEKSPRYVSRELAAELAAILPNHVVKAGVFVNESAAVLKETAEAVGLDVVQLHGNGQPLPLGFRVWKAIGMTSDFDRGSAEALDVEALLLDAPAGNQYGGTGRTFDWSLANGLAKPVIIAGGLDAGNVQEAIETARPWGVDTCSRIEREPGKKDHAKMAAFIKAALSNR